MIATIILKRNCLTFQREGEEPMFLTPEECPHKRERYCACSQDDYKSCCYIEPHFSGGVGDWETVYALHYFMLGFIPTKEEECNPNITWFVWSSMLGLDDSGDYIEMMVDTNKLTEDSGSALLKRTIHAVPKNIAGSTPP